ncbi:MAG: hypothetical protein R3C49_16185 [Planctomycetaceae bacterium]
MRTIHRNYQDPVELIWLQAAADMGMRVVRDADVFAAWDGQGTLKIGVPESLDADDSLAQMILHETCHALIEGPDAFHLPDWGLQLDQPDQKVREFACLRLQAALTQPFGLREFFASTTQFRRYYDSLPDDPLIPDGDPAVPPAQEGFRRSALEPWASALQLALRQTADIAAIVRDVAGPNSLWRTFQQDTAHA